MFRENSMTNGKILGLDIGIASVGVGIIEADTGEVVHASSRIFPAANADNNLDRRENRSGRRLYRRKKHRVKRVRDLFDKYEISTEFNNLNLNPYELRVKGLTEVLSNEELFAVLRNIIKHRGISYLDDAEDDSTGTDYAKSVLANKELLKSKTPGQIQLERLNQYGQLRGDFDIVDENGQHQRVINVFLTSAYKNEAEYILTTQSQFNPKISKEFIEDYLTILTSKRKYYVGPGNHKSRTDYGIYRTTGETLDNLFGILIGKCRYYLDEYRASKASYTAQEFNFLNDLNNLKVPTETGKLSTNQKYQLVEFAKTSAILGTDKLLKKIAKMTGGSKDDIKGYRLDNKDKPEIHTFEAYRAMAKLETIDIATLPRNVLDVLARILTLNTESEGIQEAIEIDLKDQFSQEQVDELVQFRKAKSQLFGKGWHNFSVKLMLELIPELYDTDEEQMTILTRLDKTLATKKEVKRTKYIDEYEVTDEIYNPVVAKSVRQAIKIINAAVKEWGDFDNIVIEMPRESNEDDEKKWIADAQKANAKEKDAAEKQASTLYNGKDKLPSEVFHGHKQLARKIRLWYQQGQKCLYTGQSIPINDLIHNPNMYEIDHILPLSLSFDDSLANKVLVLATANQEKGQKTPYQSIPKMHSAWSYREFKSYVLNCKGLSKKKREYLLTEEDINKIEVKRKFIERNLVDTRYASRVVLNTIQDNLKAMDKETKVSVVRGQFTSQLRRQWKIDKTRDTYHHHAIDALIIAASIQLKLWKKQNNLLLSDYKNSQKVDIETDEILTDDEYKELVFQSPYQGFVQTIGSKTFEDEILFSYQVDSKVNRKISDATIYATRKAQLAKDSKEKTYVLGKIKDIYELGVKTPSKTGFYKFLDIYKKDKSQFLIYQKDRATWDNVIEKVLEQYKPFKELNEKGKEVDFNPFEKYREQNGPVRKYGKRGFGPEIKALKYYDVVLGKGIDITPVGSKNKVVLRGLNPWRTDVYFNHKTQKYEFLGIKYSDLYFEKNTGVYGISLEKYNELKTSEKVSDESEFKFALYKNDSILVKDTYGKTEQIFRFWSRTGKVSEKHKLELKPFDKAKFEKGEKLNVIRNLYPSSSQFQENMNKPNLSIYKVKTDVLGHKYFVKKEGGAPKLNFKKKVKK